MIVWYMPSIESLRGLMVKRITSNDETLGSIPSGGNSRHKFFGPFTTNQNYFLFDSSKYSHYLFIISGFRPDI